MNTYLQFNPRNFTNLKKTLSLILGKQMVNISPLMYIYRYVLLSLRSSWSNISCLWIIVGSEQQPKYQALLYAILDVHYTLFAKLLWTYLSGSRSNAVLLILLTSELRTGKMPTAPHNGSKTFTDVIHCSVVIGRKLYWLKEIPMYFQLPEFTLAYKWNSFSL